MKKNTKSVAASLTQKAENPTGVIPDRDSIPHLKDDEKIIHLQGQGVLHSEADMLNREPTQAAGADEFTAGNCVEFFNNALLGYIILSTRGEIMKLNAACALLLGSEITLLTKRNLSTVIAEKSHLVLTDFLNRVFSDQTNAACEVELSGTGAPVILQIEGRRSGDGMRCLATMSAVTAPQESGSELCESNDRWQYAVECASDGVWDWNLINDRVFFSTQWKAMLGFSETEIGDTLDEWKNRVHPVDLEKVLAIVGSHLAGETPEYSSEHRLLCKDGSYKWILDKGRVVERGSNGKPLRVVGTHKDITSRKKTESDLFERMKEMKCINRVSEVINNASLLTGEVIEKLLMIIPDGWQYPHLAEVAVHLHGKVWETPGYKQTRHSLRKEISVHDSPAGSIEVCYSGGMFPDSGLDFLPEESDLLFRIATDIGKFIEKTGHDHALQESERKYRKLIENITDVIYEVDMHGIILFISPSVVNILGYQAEEIVGRSFTDFVGLNSNFIAKRLVELSEKNTLENEYQIITKAGEPCWIRLSTNAVFKDGIFMGGTGTLIDITARKKSEDALRESEMQYRSLANSGQALIWTSTPDKKCNYFNQVWLDFTGRSMDQELGDGWTEGIHPDDLEKCFEIFATSFDRRESFNMEYRLRYHNGEYRWLQDNGTPQYDSQGNFIGYIGHCLDINQYKLTADALQESEQQFKGAFQFSPIGMALVSPQGFFLKVNARLCSLLGYTESEFLMLSFQDISHPDDLVADMTFIRRMLAGEITTYRMEKRYFHKSGDRIWAELSVSIVKDQYNTTLYFISQIEDISVRKEVEAKARQTSELLAFYAQYSGVEPGIEFFKSLAQYIATALEADFVCIDSLEGDGLHARTLAVWNDGNFEDNIVYALKDTPSGEVVGKEVSCFPVGVTRLFPRDPVLLDLKAESYIGVTLWSHTGQPIGLIAVIRQTRFNNQLLAEDLLKMVAIRAAGELERMTMEQALRQQVELTQNVLDTTPGFLMLKDCDGLYRMVNQSFCDFMGKSKAEIIGKSDRELYSPAEAMAFIENDIEVLKTGRSEMRDWPVSGHPGKGWLHVIKTAVKDTDGNNSGILCSVSDITHRKQAEETLRKSNAYLENLINFANAPIIVWDTHFHIIRFNQAFELITGLTEDELLGKSPDILFPPGFLAQATALIQRTASGERWETVEIQIQHIDQSIRTLLCNSSTLFESDGLTRVATIVQGQDITERNRAVNEIKDKTNLLTNLIINLQEGILLEDSNRKIALTNQLFCTMFGIPVLPEYLIGADCTGSAEQSKIFFKNPDQFISSINAILAEKREVYNDVLELVDGRYFERDYIPTYLDNKYNGHLWKYRDITDRMQSRVKLEKSEERFRQVVEQSMEVVWEVDALGLYTYVSPLAREVYGYSPGQMIGKLCFYDLHPELSREQFREAAFEVFSRKENFENLNNTIVRSDGEERNLITNGIPILDETGILQGYRGIDADVTDRLKSENTLRESEEKFRTIAEQTNDLIAITDAYGIIIFASSSANSIFHLSPENMCGCNFLDFVDAADKDRAVIAFHECMDSGNLLKDVVFQMKRADGSGFIGEVNGSIYQTETQMGTLVTIRDITERTQAEQILKARLRLTEFAHDHSRNELQQKLLDELEKLTGSSIGFFHAVNHDQLTLDLQSWSSNTLQHMCNAQVGEQHYPINEAGVWVNCVHQRKAVIYNDFAGITTKGGLPEGHALINRMLAVPVIRNEMIVAIVGIGNKQEDYNERDIEIVSLLSDMAWDITERKGAEEGLKKLSQAVEQSPAVIYITSASGSIEYANSKALELSGYSSEELMDQNPRIFSSGEKTPEEYKAIWTTIGSGQEWKGEFHNKKKNGDLYWVMALISPVMDDSGKITHYLAVEEDISERKKSEEKIKQQNERLNAIISAMPDLIFVIDKDGTYSEFYSSMPDSLLIPEDPIVGSNLDALFNGEAVEYHKKYINQCLYQKRLITYEYSISGKDSASFYEARLAPLGDDRVLSFVRDITERKKAEQEIQDLNINLEIRIGQRTSQLSETNENLQNEIEERKLAEVEMNKARTEAEKANLAKSEFLSRMSHELRTPMNSILGFAQLLDMGELIPSHKKGVSHILKSGKHLLNLINEVLDISRIESGRISLSMEPVKLHSLIMEMLDIVEPNVVNQHQTIELEDSPVNLLSVKADSQRVKQVLLNLINNAIKYNRKGGHVLIKTELCQAESAGIPMVRISIKDTGLGIMPDDILKLFLPFERIGAEKSEIEGTGLGLTVVKKLMDAMGGNIGVDSIPGEGSTFWIELQLIENQTSQAQQSGYLSAGNSEISLKTGTILYIEDNISSAELVEGIIGEFRPSIQLFTSKFGRSAVELAVNLVPDLILLDLDLPDIHGSEVLENLQKEAKTKTIPVIIISADAMPQQVKKLLKAGAKNYLTKPLVIANFLQQVDEWVNKEQNSGKT